MYNNINNSLFRHLNNRRNKSLKCNRILKLTTIIIIKYLSSVVYDIDTLTRGRRSLYLIELGVEETLFHSAVDSEGYQQDLYLVLEMPSCSLY